MIFSDESSFSFFPTAERVYVLKQTREDYNPDCRLPAVQHGGGSVVVWVAMSWNSLGLIVALHDRSNSKDYLNILGDHVHPMVMVIFPDGDGIFQNGNAQKHTAHVVMNWYEEN